MRPRYRGEEMSCDETARTNSEGDGKRCSIFFDWRNCGSLVEKKKFSSTTGLRATRNPTTPKSTAVISSISQCVPGEVSFFTVSKSRSRHFTPNLDKPTHCFVCDN